ncbi:MAG: SCP2 sterol-binding domain-containing protein [Gaiellales bacterium]
MSDRINEFFATVEQRASPEQLDGVEASYRFDVTDVGSWHIDVRDRKMTVTQGEHPADCVISASEDTFEKIARGDQNPATALMLGKIKVDGDLSLALKLKDLI